MPREEHEKSRALITDREIVDVHAEVAAELEELVEQRPSRYRQAAGCSDVRIVKIDAYTGTSHSVPVHWSCLLGRQPDVKSLFWGHDTSSFVPVSGHSDDPTVPCVPARDISPRSDSLTAAAARRPGRVVRST